MATVYYPTYEGSRIANATRTWQAAEDTAVTGWDKTADFILAIAVATSKGPLAYAYKLQWRNITDAGSFADVGATGEITYSATTDLVDGAAVTSGEAGCTGPGTWQDGKESEGDNIEPDSGTYSLADEYWTEFHWALDCSNALDGKEYAFQLLTTGDNVIGVCLATLTIQAAGVTHYGVATLSGTGSLAGLGVLILSGLATLAGTGSLAALAQRIVYGLATLLGTGTLAAIGAVFKLGAATLSGVGTLTANAVTTLVSSATLSGVGTLSAIGRRIVYGIGTLTGTGTLSALAGLLLTAKSTLSGAGSLAASGALIKYGLVTLSGVGTLTASGVNILIGKATLAGIGVLSTIGTIAGGGVIHYASATLSGIGKLVVIGWHKKDIGTTTTKDLWITSRRGF